MFPTFQLRKPFHRRKRRVAADPGPPVPPPPVQIDDVAAQNAFYVDWSFDTDIASFTSLEGLFIGPDFASPVSRQQTGPRTIRCEYDVDCLQAGTWVFQPDWLDITFDPPRTLVERSGTIN